MSDDMDSLVKLIQSMNDNQGKAIQTLSDNQSSASISADDHLTYLRDTMHKLANDMTG